MSDHDIRDEMQRESHRRLRDKFAAAALTGLLAGPAAGPPQTFDDFASEAYQLADAMLREREKTNHDAAPAARASDSPCAGHAGTGGTHRSVEESSRPRRAHNPEIAGANPAAPIDDAATGELGGGVGFSSDSRAGQINRTPECESPRRECGESSLRDVPQLDNSRAAGGPEHHISEAEIDALECVVEDGRIVGMSIYGRLRSLLVRLRPEWEDELRPQPVVLPSYAKNYEKRGDSPTKREPTQPRNGALSDGPDPDSRVWETPCTPQPQATPAKGSVHGEGDFRDSQNAIEPVAWAVMATGIGSITPLCHDRKEAQQLAARLSDPHAKAVPLYRHSQPTLTDEEREAIEWAVSAARNVDHPAATLRKLLERTKETK